MTGIHELADRRPVRGANAFGSVRGALDFADDMARAMINILVHPALRAFEQVGRGVAKRRHAEDFCGGFALFAAHGIFAAGQLVPHVGIDDKHGNGRIAHRHQLGFPRAAVEQQHLVFPAHDGNELVHDAARHSGIFVLGLLAKQRLFNRIKFFAGDGFEQRGGGHFKGCAAGQTAAERHGRVNHRIEAAGIQSAGEESGNDADGIIGPRAFRKRLQRFRKVHGGGFVAEGGVKPDLVRLLGRTIGGDDGVELNRHRKHKTIVVVGVFADDVDATGRGDNPARLTAIHFDELPDGVVGEFFQCHSWCNIVG